MYEIVGHVPGALLLYVVYQHNFTVDTQAILQRGSGFLRHCLRKGRVPKLAGLPTPWPGKGSFQIILFKTHRFFMPDKCILKINVYPMTPS